MKRRPAIDRKDRCKAAVWVRDTYRYSGRGKSGFSMHYNRQRCRRRADDTGHCWQHRRLAATGMFLPDFERSGAPP